MRTAPEYETIQSKQILNHVNLPNMPFDWSINPYRGCSHGCSFCYARATHRFLGLATDDTFRQHVLVKEDAAAILERQLSAKLRKHGGNKERLANEIGVVTIGTATDPYQSIEARVQVTRACLEVLAAFRIHTSITTRSPLILRDLDVLQKMRIDSVNISVNTLDTTIWRKLEPATPSPIKRLETVQTLVAAGIRTGVFLAPIIPGLTDGWEELDAVIEAAAKHDAQFLMRSVLRLSPDVKSWFLRVIDEHYPGLRPVYERMYRDSDYPPKSYVARIMKQTEPVMQRCGMRTFRVTTSVPTQPESRQLTLPL